MSARVLVVTVTYRTGATLKPFLDSVQAASVHPLDIVVVDNASGDLEVERALTESAGARLIELPQNRGYGSGIAAGVEASARSDYVLVANPDVVFARGAIDVLVEAVEADPTIGSIGPRIDNPDGTVYPSARRLPSIGAGIGHALLGPIWRGNPWTRQYRVEGEESVAARDAGWLSGACVLVRRTAYDQIGGFDPKFFMYFEDVDLGARLADAGWRNRYEPSAVITHAGAHSTAKVGDIMAAVHHDSAYLYLAGRYDAWYQAPIRWLLRIGLGARKRWVTRA